jgi:Aerotolerance regulator N-terminal/von Willebrand factor type A domain
MPYPPLIFAIGFTQLWMLGWLAAAAAPVVIHLWNRRKYREVSWAAMEYLLAAVRKNSRRVRIEQWLLLAVRTAVVVLLVLAVAGPYLQTAGLAAGAGQPVLKVLVIDSSYSMGYKPTDKSRFERARQLAAQIVDASTPGDGFALVQMGFLPRVVIGTPTSIPKDVLGEIENLKLEHGGADLPATLAKVKELTEQAAQTDTRWSHSEIYFLTDLGQNTWGTNLQTAAAELAKTANLFVVDLGQTDCENAAVSSLRAVEPYATVNAPLNFDAEVVSYGRQSHRQPIEWWVDGQQEKEDFVDLAPGKQASASFQWRFEQPGDHSVEARLLGDALEIDNHRWLAVRVEPAVEVLVLNGDGAEAAAKYLTKALNPEAEGNQSPIHVHLAAENALLETNLSQYDAVFASNVAQFTAAEAQALARFVRAGGGLVFFLGDRVQAERYNQELGGGRGGTESLLPVELLQPTENPAARGGNSATGESQFSFDPLGYRDPIVAPFAGNERAGLLSTPINRYFRMKPLATAGSAEAEVHPRVALAIRETGDPVIVNRTLGRGEVIVVGLPASLNSVDPLSKNPWTLMPAWHSFLPLVQEILSQAVSGHLAGHNQLVGQPLSGAAATGGESVSISAPASEGHTSDTVHVNAAADGSWSFAETGQSGIYRVQSAAGGNLNSSERFPVTLFAVNVDTGDLSSGESNLNKIEPTSLPREFNVLTNWQNLDQRATVDLGTRHEVHRWLLYAALAMMLGETGLAWWIGFKSR